MTEWLGFKVPCFVVLGIEEFAPGVQRVAIRGTQVRVFEPESVLQEHFEPGERIFSEGDFGDKCFVIVKGEVEVIKNGEAVATLGQGDVFGEIALISDNPRNAGVQAKSPVDVITVSRDAFGRLVKHLPGVKTTMEGLMAQKIGKQVDLATTLIKD